MTLPSAQIVEVPPAGQIAETAPANVAVYFFCSSKGPLSTPTPFGAQQQASCETVFGCGPVREAQYMQAKLPVQSVCIRLPKTAIVAATHDFTITSATLAGFGALSGTPTIGRDAVITCTTGGTTGTSFSYTLSVDGGVITGSPVTQGAGLTIVVDGVTLTLTTGKTITAGDVITWWTTPASATILPTTVTRVASSTSTLVFSGAPEDGYEIAVTFLVGGTVGQPGILFQYTLDAKAGIPTLSPVTALPLNGVFPIPDHGSDLTGVTLTVGAGTVDALDSVRADTTPPRYQWSDAAAALDTLRGWNGTWSFPVFTGYGTRAFRDSLEAKLQTFASTGRFTWGATPGRDMIAGERTASANNVTGDLAYTARLTAEWTGSQGNRTPPQFASQRVTCPITGRRNRRPVTLSYVPRIIGTTPDTDPGDRTLPNDGALSADVSIHNDVTGALEEHDARVNTSLYDLGGNVLRTWYGEKGLAPGVYPAGGRLMSASGDIQRWAYRRVQDLADAASFAAMARLVSSKFGVWASTVRPPYVAGNIMPWDLTNMQQQLFAAVFAAVGAYVSAPRAGGIVVTVNPTPGLVAGNTVVYQDTKLVGKKYLDTFQGTLGFTNPAFASLFQAAS